MNCAAKKFFCKVERKEGTKKNRMTRVYSNLTSRGWFLKAQLALTIG